MFAVLLSENTDMSFKDGFLVQWYEITEARPLVPPFVERTGAELEVLKEGRDAIHDLDKAEKAAKKEAKKDEKDNKKSSLRDLDLKSFDNQQQKVLEEIIAFILGE